MNALYIMGATCVVIACLTAILRNRKSERGRLTTKLLASLLFCTIGLVAAALREQMSITAALLLGALLLGLLGDVLLGLDHFVAKDLQPFLFLLGGAPFFLGHVLYIVLLLLTTPLNPWLLLVLPLVPLLFLALHKTKIVDFGNNLLPLLAYGTVLSAMVMCTLNIAKLGASLPQGEDLSRLMLLPGILFVISDTTLFLNKFGGVRTRKWIPVFSFGIMLPYYTAQSLFALAVRYI
ncbi:MAG: lysoplasmalogenase [Oscillospiraceae bacterium]|jgi:uncharacterized membrane protein YhhN|nr:lysoplasmalogenase [Oscillospiraceae bacterium]